ncbi:hypothetical protein [Carboxylicivirga sp. M1479]|uniref:hypothetical protein n=1 Tax=Carboxylicivirga sp. M1479 TaxID=2594476 RepID=UPI00163D864E|nr:hypothetical protein [Carboxylicivirga sp. M1479]
MGKKKYSRPVIQSYDLDRDICLVLSSDGFGELPTPPGTQKTDAVNTFDENPFDQTAFE